MVMRLIVTEKTNGRGVYVVEETTQSAGSRLEDCAETKRVLVIKIKPFSTPSVRCVDPVSSQ